MPRLLFFVGVSRKLLEVFLSNEFISMSSMFYEYAVAFEIRVMIGPFEVEVVIGVVAT